MESIPYDKRSGKIWFNGEPINWSEVKIHVLSHGLHYASCVFEGERVYDGEIFKLEEHTERLFHSASRLGFKIPYTPELLNKACKEIIAIQKVKNGYVRPIAWRGSEMMAISAQQTKIHVAIASWEWGSYFDPKLKVEGIKLNISKWSDEDILEIPLIGDEENTQSVNIMTIKEIMNARINETLMILNKLIEESKFKNKIIIFQFIGGLISLLALWWLMERILT